MGTCAAYHARLQPSLPKFSTSATGVNVRGIPTGIRTRKHVVVKASNSSTLRSSLSATRRNTLSSNWDACGGSSVSSVTPSVSWLPRFEELDTTNMLLRQRIIFLGSQVPYLLVSSHLCHLLGIDYCTAEFQLFVHRWQSW